MIDIETVNISLKNKLELVMKKISLKKKISIRWKNGLRWIKGISKSVICSLFIIPVFVGVMTSWLLDCFTDVELHNSEIIPYEQINEEVITSGVGKDDNAKSYSDEVTDDHYRKACAVRTVMYCNKPFGTYLNNAIVHVNSVEKYEFSAVSYFAYVENTTVRVYAINYGNGIFKSREVSLYVKKMVGDRKDIMQDYSWKNVEISGEQLVGDNGKRATVRVEDLYGGDGRMIYSFQMSEKILEELEMGNYFGLYVGDPYSNCSEENWIAWITMENGKILINGGGGEGETSITDTVYIDVGKGANQKIESSASGAITGYSVIDLVLVPSESCIVEYSVHYDVDGEIFKTENYKTTFEVPLYEPLSIHIIAEYMNENHIENFIYQKTNWNLSREVEYIPKETTDIIQ